MPAARAPQLVPKLVPKRALGAFVRAVYPRIEPELAGLGAYVPRGGTAVDVGGWLGPWTRRLARYADRVMAVEADPALAAYLRRTFPRVRVVHAAASDEAGEIELWAAPGGVWAGTSSVVHRTGMARRVPRVALDDLGLADVRFMKLDVEGHEAAVLKGAAGVIRRDRPMLLLELEERHQPVASVVELLASWGYRGYVMPHREWVPLERFDLVGHQRSAIRRVEEGLARRVLWPYPRYVNSVLFRPVR